MNIIRSLRQLTATGKQAHQFGKDAGVSNSDMLKGAKMMAKAYSGSSGKR